MVLERSWKFLAPLEHKESKKLVDFGVDLSAPTEYWLSESWQQLFKPNLRQCVDSLEPIVTANLQAAHALLMLNNKANEIYDSLSFRRQAIGHSSQFPALFDTLVDAARDILEIRVNMCTSDCRCLSDRWFSSGVPILTRLAVHGVAEDLSTSADVKIQWVIARNLLFRSHVKVEIFDLLRKSYAKSGHEVRRLLVDLAVCGPDEEETKDISDETKHYEIFNLLFWLNQIAPECTIARGALDSIKAKHPDFTPREHPDLNYWITSSRGTAATTCDFDAILQRPPASFIKQLRTAPVETPWGEQRHDYVCALMTLVAKNPTWGFRFQEELIAQRLKDPDIWTQVFNGWREARLDHGNWIIWFKAVDNLPELDFILADGIADVLHARGPRKEWAIPVDLMDQAYALSLRVWAVVRENANGESPGDNNWFSLASNRPGGKLAMFWLEYISVLRGRTGDQWELLPAQIKLDLISIVESHSCAAALARVIIAGQFHYFFYLDAAFARSTILPLFDWNVDELRARQCWNGFLAVGRWREAYLDELLPKYAQTLRRILEFPEGCQRSFAEHIAGIAVFGIGDPMADNWLSIFIGGFDSEMRENFANAVEKYLKGTDWDPQKDLWRRWLCRYWQDRIVGKPLLLERGEMRFMFRWPLYTSGMFPEAVKLLSQSPKPDLQYLLSAEEMKILQDLAKPFCSSTAEYLMLILGGSKQFYNLDQATALVETLEKVGLDKTKLTALRDEMLRLQ